MATVDVNLKGVSTLEFPSGVSSASIANGKAIVNLSAGGGSGTVTNTSGNLTAGQLIIGNGTADIKVGDLTGDVTTAGSTASTIANNAVTTAKINASAVTEAKIGLSNVTTNDVTTAQHGFAPKAPNDATKFLDGTGNYTVPSGTAAAFQDSLGQLHGTSIGTAVAAASATMAYAANFTGGFTTSLVVETSTTPRKYRYAIGATHNFAAVNENNVNRIFVGSLAWLRIRSSISNLSNMDYWIGLSDNNAASVAMGSNPTTTHTVAFRYSTSAGDTTFHSYTSNGATSTVADTGVTVDTALHTFKIVPTSGTTVQFYIDGVLKTTHSTTVPSTGMDAQIFVDNKINANSVNMDQTYLWWQEIEG